MGDWGSQAHPQTPSGQLQTLRQAVGDNWRNHPKPTDPAGLQALRQGTQYHLVLCAGEETEAQRDADPHLERNQPGALLPFNTKRLVRVSTQRQRGARRPAGRAAPSPPHPPRAGLAALPGWAAGRLPVTAKRPDPYKCNQDLTPSLNCGQQGRGRGFCPFTPLW